jgi:3-isopropylmalate/(R)-2-methylmalate dehydratase small subunit
MKHFGGKVLFLDRADINTDEIIPAKYLTENDKAALRPHALEDLRLPDFEPLRDCAGKGVIVARENFGCGSSREHAPMVLKQNGVALVLAESFARIFYRNALNIGLAIVECPEAARAIQAGDELAFDLAQGLIEDRSQAKTWQVAPFPAFVQDIISNGGLIELARQGGLQ